MSQTTDAIKDNLTILETTITSADAKLDALGASNVALAAQVADLQAQIAAGADTTASLQGIADRVAADNATLAGHIPADPAVPQV